VAVGAQGNEVAIVLESSLEPSFGIDDAIENTDPVVYFQAIRAAALGTLMAIAAEDTLSVAAAQSGGCHRSM
jgi:hypothetical protein